MRDPITGFVEWQCACKCAGIVRVGRGCRQEPDDWDFAFVIKRVGQRAIWKALISPQWGWPWWLAWVRWLRPMPTVSKAHTRAAFAAVARENLRLERDVEWGRLRKTPRRVVSSFDDGDNRGKMTMKTSKHGIPHVKSGAHLKGGAVHLSSVADIVLAALALAEAGKITFSHPVIATHKHGLASQLAGVKLQPNQSLLGFRVRGDLANSGLPMDPNVDFPGGVCDLPKFKGNVLTALVLQFQGKLQLDDLSQADTNEEVHALAGSVNLTAHDDAFLAFVQTEHD